VVIVAWDYGAGGTGRAVQKRMESSCQAVKQCRIQANSTSTGVISGIGKGVIGT
jgi:hypothetical protein